MLTATRRAAPLQLRKVNLSTFKSCSTINKDSSTFVELIRNRASNNESLCRLLNKFQNNLNQPSIPDAIQSFIAIARLVNQPLCPSSCKIIIYREVESPDGVPSPSQVSFSYENHTFDIPITPFTLFSVGIMNTLERIQLPSYVEYHDTFNSINVTEIIKRGELTNFVTAFRNLRTELNLPMPSAVIIIGHIKTMREIHPKFAIETTPSTGKNTTVTLSCDSWSQKISIATATVSQLLSIFEIITFLETHGEIFTKEDTLPENGVFAFIDSKSLKLRVITFSRTPCKVSLLYVDTSGYQPQLGLANLPKITTMEQFVEKLPPQVFLMPQLTHDLIAQKLNNDIFDIDSNNLLFDFISNIVTKTCPAERDK